MKTTRQQMIAKLHIILKQQNAIEHKAAIYASYGVESSRELTDAQLSHLIMQLEQSQNTTEPIEAVAADDLSIKKLRSDILSLLTKSPRSTSVRQRGLGLPNDWAILNPFIVRHGHKLLFQMNIEELHTFHRKLLAMRDSGWTYRIDEAKVNPNIQISPRQSSESSPSSRRTTRDYLIMPTSKVLS